MLKKVGKMDDDINQLLNNGQMTNPVAQRMMDASQQAAPTPVPMQPISLEQPAMQPMTAVDAPQTQPAFQQYQSAQYAQPTDAIPAADLESVKQQALSGLIPLVDDLDQSAEDKFKTIMMIIQASDRSDLVQKALAAAQSITDQHIKAQALLDIVNEVNYFTKKSETK
jgi:hypothetical protein